MAIISADAAALIASAPYINASADGSVAGALSSADGLHMLPPPSRHRLADDGDVGLLPLGPSALRLDRDDALFGASRRNASMRHLDGLASVGDPGCCAVLARAVDGSAKLCNVLTALPGDSLAF